MSLESFGESVVPSVEASDTEVFKSTMLKFYIGDGAAADGQWTWRFFVDTMKNFEQKYLFNAILLAMRLR